MVSTKKTLYKRLVKRFNDGTKYMNDPDVSQKKKEKWQDEYINVMSRLSLLIGELGLTSDEVQRDIDM